MYVGHIVSITLQPDPDVHLMRTVAVGQGLERTDIKGNIRSAIGETMDACTDILRLEAQEFLTSRNIKGDQRKGWTFCVRFSEVEGGRFWREPTIGGMFGGYDVWGTEP